MLTVLRPCLDDLGNISQDIYNADNEAVIAVDPDNNITATQYTGSGQVQSVTDADSNVTNYFYDY